MFTSKKNLAQQAVTVSRHGLVDEFRRTCPQTHSHILDKKEILAEFLKTSCTAYSKIYSRKELKIIINDCDSGPRVRQIADKRTGKINQHFAAQGYAFALWLDKEGYLKL